MDFREKINYLKTASLPDEASLLEVLDLSISVLEEEKTDYRPEASDSSAGGLLDFTSSEKPVIVLPDLHGRRTFLPLLLDSKLFSGIDETVAQLLSENKVTVISVGDLWHTETPGFCAERWNRAYEDWLNGIADGENMMAEMEDSLGTFLQVMELKRSFPESFHVLKGNHENIMNADGEGNFSFHKYVMEGEMVRDFLQQYYSDATVHLINLVEKNLPVCAVFRGFGISHAEPAEAFERQQVIDFHCNAGVIEGLTWTGNGQVKDVTVLDFYRELTDSDEEAFWIAGHRPVPEKVLYRQEGHFIQFHNPFEKNVAVLEPGKAFSESCIVSLEA